MTTDVQAPNTEAQTATLHENDILSMIGIGDSRASEGVDNHLETVYSFTKGLIAFEIVGELGGGAIPEGIVNGLNAMEETIAGPTATASLNTTAPGGIAPGLDTLTPSAPS